jgi:hypothetical protein
MIYGAAFTGLPSELKQRVYGQLGAALAESSPAPEFAYLPADEKAAIRNILRGTVPDLPAGW